MSEPVKPEDLAKVKWDEDKSVDPSKVTWDDAREAVSKKLGLGAMAASAGPGGIPNDVRFGKEHVLGVAASVPIAAGASAALTAGGAAAMGSALMSPWAGAVEGGYAGYKSGGIPGAITGAAKGAIINKGVGTLAKLLHAAQAAKAVQTAASTVEAAAPAVEAAAPAVAAKIAEAAPAVKAASGAAIKAENMQSMFKAVKDAIASGQKLGTDPRGKIWFRLVDGKPAGIITSDQAGKLADANKTWIANMWGAK